MNISRSCPITTRAILSILFALSLTAAAHAQQNQPTPSPTDATRMDVNTTTNLDEQQAPQYPQIPVRAKGLTFGDRLDLYTHSILNPGTVIGPAFGAAITGYGRMLISRTIRFGVAAVDHEDPRFIRSNEAGFWRRARFVTNHFFVARTDSGSQIPAFSRFAGTYGTAFISNAWYPESRANSYHAMQRGTTALSAGFGWNMLREFWPDIKQRLGKF